MFTKMKDRLQQFLTLEQLSPARFADILGVQRSGLSHILSGRNKPGFDFISKMLQKFPQINSEWLLTGKGKMYKEVRDNKDESDLFNNKQVAPIIETIQPSENRIIENQKEIIRENRLLKKVIFIYDDMTFEEYSPNEL